MSNAPVPFNGLTPQQVESILEQIAVSAEVLVQHAINSATHADSNSMHVAQHLGERIGALAELAVDGVAHTDFVGWALGERFRTLGKESGGDRHGA